jgi:integral membrane protein (TIGR01906 family)
MRLFLKLLLACALPFVILLGCIRVTMLPWYLEWQYLRPSFPADSFGMTTADRLHYGKLALAYLFNGAPSGFLGEQRFADGRPLYNERELSHMVDVQRVTGAAMQGGLLAGVLLLFSAGLLLARPPRRDFWQAIFWGSSALVFTLIALVTYILLNFEQFFTDFHKVFFSGDSWLFLYSDTLIRLFPLPLWSDAFTIVGVATLIIGVGLAILGWRQASRPA